MNDDKTIAEVKEWLAEHFDEGVSCPCCDQLVKRYKRKLNSSMAYVLILMYRWDREYTRNGRPSDYLHVPSFLATTGGINPHRAAAIRGDWAKLRHWGLIEEKPGQQREDGSGRAGFYKITAKGCNFARGFDRVPAHIYLYNQEVQATPDDEKIPMVTIQEALAEKFNYLELMEGV